MNNLYSNDIEENVLGCLIVYEECKRYIAILDGTDFYSQINRKRRNPNKYIKHKAKGNRKKVRSKRNI